MARSLIAVLAGTFTLRFSTGLTGAMLGLYLADLPQHGGPRVDAAVVGVFAATAATLFLGGWYLPFLSLDANYMNVLGPVIVLAKMMVVAFLIFWFRFTYPRFREDQLQQLAWKYLIPIALLNIIATMILKVAF